MHYIHAAIIITGGYNFNSNSTAPTSVEILRDDSTPWCSLPDIPGRLVRHAHTQSGLVACGGFFSNNAPSCYTFSSGTWTKSHTLSPERYGHSAWSSPSGVVLLGGRYYNGSKDSAVLLSDNGDSTKLFELKHDTAAACSIEMTDHVVVTGGAGYDPNEVNGGMSHRATVYNEQVSDMCTVQNMCTCVHCVQ